MLTSSPNYDDVDHMDRLDRGSMSKVGGVTGLQERRAYHVQGFNLLASLIVNSLLTNSRQVYRGDTLPSMLTE